MFVIVINMDQHYQVLCPIYCWLYWFQCVECDIMHYINPIGSGNNNLTIISVIIGETVGRNANILLFRCTNILAMYIRL